MDFRSAPEFHLETAGDRTTTTTRGSRSPSPWIGDRTGVRFSNRWPSGRFLRSTRSPGTFTCSIHSHHVREIQLTGPKLDGPSSRRWQGKNLSGQSEAPCLPHTNPSRLLFVPLTLPVTRGARRGRRTVRGKRPAEKKQGCFRSCPEVLLS